MATGLFNLKQVNQAISQGAWSGYIAPKWVEYLVVAGGGAGGGCSSGTSGMGGGGAGGLLTGIVTVAAGTSYTVTVGAGGTGGTSTGASGSNSVFGSISASGGGGGGAFSSNGVSGGSGGGGSADGVRTPGQGVAGQGNAGGTSTNNSAGGGGGAGTVGLNSGGSSGPGGNGGAGIASAISGSVVTYAGGGGGAYYSGSSTTTGQGGVGGGGTAGYIGSTNGTSGGGNTGGGGGGGDGYLATGTGGSGGSGIVVVRYPGNVQFFTGGTLSYANGYMIHTFYASGTLAPTTPTPYVTDYQISRSLRFNSADSAYLNRTPASASNRTTWTYSGWVKRSKLGTVQDIFAGNAGSSNANFLQFIFYTDDSFWINGWTTAWRKTSQVFRDVSAWYHIVVVWDTTQTTAANRIKLYVNGTQVTAFSTSNDPALNDTSGVNSNSAHYISTYGVASEYYDGYMTEVNFIDGQALTPSSFGYTDPDTGVWSPLAFVGTYGTNGFYLNFSDNSNTTAATLGKDYSGNGNNWTPNNFSVTAGAGNDSLVDSPTSYGTDTGVGGTVRGNYATLNPLANGPNCTLSNGNLDLATTNNSGNARATIGISSGKWYWEVTLNTGTNTFFTGLVTSSASVNDYLGGNANSWGYYSSNGQKWTNGSGAAYGSAYTNGDVIGVAFDADAGTLTFYKNNTSQGTAFTGLTSGPYFPASSDAGNGSYSTTSTANFGQRPFAYTAPSGYKALCTQNLPTPTIGATSTTLAGKYFNPVLYTGNATTNAITGVGFQPDFVWMKNRASAYYHGLYDAVRGTGTSKSLYSNTTEAEGTNSANQNLVSFDTDGFTLGATSSTNVINTSAQSHVAWNWKANGSGSTNTSGSITSTVSANTTSGFSVVTWTCPSSGAGYTVGHGLGATPAMIIVKERSATNDWYVWHQSFASTTQGNLRLNTTAAVGTSSLIWNNTAPTSTVFSTYVGTTLAASGTGVAYCFAQIAGYSAFGSYTGNGSADGPFVFCGFRPAYLMIKRTDANIDWFVWDSARSTYNVTNIVLYPNGSYAEAAGTAVAIDFLSNGFKIRNTDSSQNASGGNFIFAAFATAPFKFSLAR